MKTRSLFLATLLCFGSVFAIVDPFSAVPVMLALVGGLVGSFTTTISGRRVPESAGRSPHGRGRGLPVASLRV